MSGVLKDDSRVVIFGIRGPSLYVCKYVHKLAMMYIFPDKIEKKKSKVFKVIYIHIDIYHYSSTKVSLKVVYI